MTPQRKLVHTVRDALTKHESAMGARAQLECLRDALTEQANYYDVIGNYTRCGWFDAAAEAVQGVLRANTIDIAQTEGR